jgi:hypothetical protein
MELAPMALLSALFFGANTFETKETSALVLPE